VTPLTDLALGVSSAPRNVHGDTVSVNWSPRTVGVTAVGVIGVVAVGAQLGGTDDGVSVCTVRHLSGGWCPGCGATRAARHLLHGQVGAAWRDHPWVLLAAAQVLVIGAMLAVVIARRERIVVRRRWITAVGLANVAALAVTWVVRVASGAIPSPL